MELSLQITLVYLLTAVFMVSYIIGIERRKNSGDGRSGKALLEGSVPPELSDWVECQGVERWQRDGAREQNLQGVKCRMWLEYGG